MYTNKWYDAVIKVLLAPFFVTVEEGAKGNVYLATAERIGTGKYYEKSKIVNISKRYDTDHKISELIDYSKQYMKKVTSKKK